MKICIVTVYNSLNYGAYLQAYALNKYLKKMGVDVSFLKTNARKPFRTTLKIVLKNLLKFNFKRMFFEIEKFLKFKNAQKEFCKIKRNKKLLKVQDMFIFGSDEIWNISRKDIRKNPILFGVGIPDNYFISYAPSLNTTTLEDIEKDKNFIAAIEKFDRLSVRDYHSLNVIGNITRKNVQVVMDPTFLLDNNEYTILEKDCNKNNFILLYAYMNDLNGEQIKSIKNFSQLTNLKILSVGLYNDWCDENIPASPFEFLSYMKNAKYVITNTFHGTLFSIIYNKQFVTFANNKVKITDILQRLNLEGRNATGENNLMRIFENEIDYSGVMSLLESQIKHSKKFIKNSIKERQKIKNESIT